MAITLLNLVVTNQEPRIGESVELYATFYNDGTSPVHLRVTFLKPTGEIINVPLTLNIPSDKSRTASTSYILQPSDSAMKQFCVDWI